MFKRIAAVVMAVIMTLTVAAVFTSCSGDASGLKIGVILVGDETEGYTKAIWTVSKKLQAPSA